ncbi:hypothetical protein ACQPZG_06875 [Streptomyces sp. CA-294286]|uniref:hypothetical protein n=1 Tax=Streptomyces sp. CA-294286 TaxID=3240070 RepID=UPI003D8C290D
MVRRGAHPFVTGATGRRAPHRPLGPKASADESAAAEAAYGILAQRLADRISAAFVPVVTVPDESEGRYRPRVSGSAVRRFGHFSLVLTTPSLSVPPCNLVPAFGDWVHTFQLGGHITLRFWPLMSLRSRAVSALTVW